MRMVCQKDAQAADEKQAVFKLQLQSNSSKING
jgi:hypothetical protein